MSSIILLSGILNIFIGLVVWLRDPQKKLNFGFAIFSWATALSISMDYIFRFIPTLFVLRSSYAAAALVPLSALIWIIEICQINFRSLQLWKKIMILLPTPIFVILPFIDGLVIKEISYLTVLGYKGELGPFFILYSLYFVLYEASFIYLLYRNQRKAQGALKLQSRFILFGISSYGIVAVTFSLILPNYFGIFDFTLLDAPSLILFVGFTGYAILRLHLFNIKILSTELLVFTLTTFIFVRTVLADTTQERIINGILFLLTITTGTFLIRSVIREVSQRERIEKLAAELKVANTRLLDLDKQKSEFVSFASHQLRAPLTAMRGYASLLLEGEFGQISKETFDAISRILESAKTLANIVDDYLNVSRIELGTMKYAFEVLNFKELVENVIEEIKPNITRSGLELRFHTKPSNKDERFMVKADKDKIKQVVINLIDNSVKYTTRGYIDVSVIKDLNNRKIIFSVRDTGVGISPEVMPKLFSKFVRANSANKQNIYGTGLGLFVAKDVVTAHKGRIWAESDGEGKGSAFFVELDIMV